MNFEAKKVATPEGEQAEERKEEQLGLETYLKTHKEVILSKDDPEVDDTLRRNLESRVGTAISDGKTLEYIDKEGNWIRVSIDASKISDLGMDPRSAIKSLGFRFVTVNEFYEGLDNARASKKKRLAQEGTKGKEGFDF